MKKRKKQCPSLKFYCRIFKYAFSNYHAKSIKIANTFFKNFIKDWLKFNNRNEFQIELVFNKKQLVFLCHVLVYPLE